MITNNQLLEQNHHQVNGLPQANTDEDSHDVYTPEQLILEEIRTKRHESIPVSHLVLEASLVDDSHVESLKDSMSRDRGQITPITVRARLIESGTIVYDIIDGFHRSHALSLISKEKEEEIMAGAVVVYGCSDEELFDLRVLAANSVASVKFARRADWMYSSFISARWVNQRIYSLIESGDITLSQVFAMAYQKSSGSRLKLTELEVEELKNWATKKAKNWNKPLSTLSQETRTVEVSAPDLVKKVRKGGGGKDGKGVLTHARLKAVSDRLPNDYPLQRKLVDLAIEKNLIATDLICLATLISKAKENRHFTEIEEILDNPRKFLTDKEKNPEISNDIEKQVEQKTREEEIGEQIDIARLEEIASVQQAMIEVLSGRRQFNSTKITQAVLGTLERKLQWLDHGIDGFGEPLVLDSKMSIMFDSFNTVSNDKFEMSVELTREESDVFWLLLQYTGKHIDFRTINFLMGEGIKVAEVVNSIRDKLNELSDGLGNRLSEDGHLGYGWV